MRNKEIGSIRNIVCTIGVIPVDYFCESLQCHDGKATESSIVRTSPPRHHSEFRIT